MSSAPEIEAAMFKPVGDRYVFQAPNRWVFGRPPRYLVTEAQKQALLAIVAPPRPALRVAIIVAGILAWTLAVSGFMWMVSPHDDPTTADLLVMAVLIVGPLLAALAMMLRHHLRRMQPILAGASRTDERITRRELRTAMAGALSLRRAMLYGSLWTLVLLFQAVSLYFRSAKHPVFGDVQSGLALFTAAIAAGLMIHYFRIAARKCGSGANAAP